MYKKVISFLLSAIITAGVLFTPVSAVTVAPADHAATGTVTVTASSLNVRTGAGGSFAKLGVVAKGQKFTVCGYSNAASNGKAWYKISYGTGYGFVCSAYVTFNGTIPQPPKPVVAAAADYAASGTATASGAVNVRTGAGESFDKVGSAQNGAKYTVCGCSKDSTGRLWYKICFGAGYGFISSSVCTFSGTASVPEPKQISVAPANHAASGKATASATPVNVRAGAGDSFEKVGTASKGEVFTVCGYSNDTSGRAWYKICFGKGYGYISSAYCTFEDAASAPKPVSVAPADYGASGKATANATPVNVRAGAGESFDKVGTASKGEVFTVCGYSNDSGGRAWYKICFGKGYGYISSAYCTFEDAYSPVPTGKLTVSATPVNVRKGAGTSYDKLGSVSKGEVFPVYDSVKAADGVVWYKISYGSGYGYIMSTLASYAPTQKSSTRYIKRTITVKSGGAKVYSGPGTGNAMLGSVNAGSKYTVTDWRDDSSGTTWYQFTLGGKNVWINRLNTIVSDSYTAIPVRNYSAGGAPLIYISPSKQPYNKYASGSTNEQEQMYRVGERLKKILDSEYYCTTYIAPTSLELELKGRALDAFNRGADIYLAIHSNSDGAGPVNYGAMGYYFPGSTQSKKLAETIIAEMGKIAPKKNTISKPLRSGMDAFDGTGYTDVRDPSYYGMVSVLAEVEFHDNRDSAEWIKANTDKIARALANSLEKTFGLRKK